MPKAVFTTMMLNWLFVMEYLIIMEAPLYIITMVDIIFILISTITVGISIDTQSRYQDQGIMYINIMQGQIQDKGGKEDRAMKGDGEIMNTDLTGITLTEEDIRQETDILAEDVKKWGSKVAPLICCSSYNPFQRIIF